jgi:hypothetical protein
MHIIEQGTGSELQPCGAPETWIQISVILIET